MLPGRSLLTGLDLFPSSIYTHKCSTAYGTNSQTGPHLLLVCSLLASLLPTCYDLSVSLKDSCFVSMVLRVVVWEVMGSFQRSGLEAGGVTALIDLGRDECLSQGVNSQESEVLGKSRPGFHPSLASHPCDFFHMPSNCCDAVCSKTLISSGTSGALGFSASSTVSHTKLLSLYITQLKYFVKTRENRSIHHHFHFFCLEKAGFRTCWSVISLERSSLSLSARPGREGTASCLFAPLFVL